jgi:hypothetical protein
MRRSLLHASFLASCLASVLLAASSAHAQAPVSAADREAARDLFKEGYDLQNAGRFSDALDRFRRSQQVFPAPTALLHIAECEVQLGQLVEAAETYRALARQSLPAGSPPAFIAAQTQGTAELQQVEPRIPHLRIDVRPPNTQGLVVLLDDQPVNPALLDVERPVDAGQHKLSAQAPGYEKLEGLVTVREKEPAKTVLLQLKAAPPGTPMMMAPPMGAPQGQVIYVAQPPPPPVEVAAPVYYRPHEASGGGSRSGLFGGLRLGAIVPAGSDITQEVGPGFEVGGEFNFRFARRFFVGALVEHGFLSPSSNVNSALNGLGVTATFGTTNFDAVFGVLTNPDHFGALFDIGVGYRTLSSSFSGALASSSSASSGEFLIGSGLWIPTGRYFRIVPRVDATFGSLSASSTDLSGSGSGSVGYAMISLDVAGYFNIDFH